jgi:hypothetical protein
MAVEIRIYLHGFFFTEVQGDNLVIASPYHNMHAFGFWDHQQNFLQPFPASSNTFPWIQQLRQGQANSFDKDLFQFTRADLGMGSSEVFINLPSSQYPAYVTLPLPEEIKGIRAGGNITEFGMDTSGKVAKSIIKHCGSPADLSLIVRLTYMSSGQIGFTDISFFAEHCSPPDKDMLNTLFDDARKVFPNFDLTLLKLNSGKPLPGAGDDNERKLCEAGKRLKNNPCPPCTDLVSSARLPGVPLLRTANCPQFGIVAG